MFLYVHSLFTDMKLPLLRRNHFIMLVIVYVFPDVLRILLLRLLSPRPVLNFLLKIPKYCCFFLVWCGSALIIQKGSLSEVKWVCRRGVCVGGTAGGETNQLDHTQRWEGGGGRVCVESFRYVF